MKNKMKFVGIGGVLLGMILSRWADRYYGINGRLAVGIFGLIISMIALIVLICLKKYLAAIVLFGMFSPAIIILLGMYLNNIYMIVGALILLLVFSNLMVKKIAPWLKNRKK